MRLLLVLLVLVVIVTEAIDKYANLKQNTMAGSDNDDEVNRVIDIYEKRYDLPVPFGHIFKEGHEDPMSVMKQPIDLLELEMRYTNNSEEAKMLNSDPKGIQKIKKTPGVIASPRDEYLYRKDDKRARDDSSRSTSKKTNNSAPMWFDLPGLQMKNQETPRRSKIKNNVIGDSKKLVTDTQLKTQQNMKTFADQSFNLQQRMPAKIKRINWTTCDEFGKGAKFHPKDIVGVQWVPFFIWRKLKLMYVKVHTFSFPKRTEVKFYKDVYSPYLNVTIDWNQPKLIMKVQKLETLLIASDRKGLFDGIIRIDIPEYVKQKKVMLPMKTLRMKTVGNYLAMMHCDYNFAQILAVSGEEPPTPGKKLSEAKILNFRGRGTQVSRNFEEEMMEARDDEEEKLEKEKRKFLISDEPIPSLF